MEHLEEKQKLMDIIAGKEKMYSRSIYVMSMDQYVKAKSLEEAEEKFQMGHPDVIDPGDTQDCEHDGGVWEMEDITVEEYYGE